MLGRQKRKQTVTSGFTLIEGLVVLFIASVVIVTFLNVFSQGSAWLLESEKKTTAVAIANEKMEMLRNLAYANVGVSGGIPDGVVAGEEFLTKAGTQYRIVTDIRYIDDPYDGTFGGSPNDTLNVDQKRATMRVLWGDEDETQRASLSAIFVPPGIESLSGAGTISINVIDSSGAGVPAASVHVVHPGEGIDFSTTTDSTGNVLLPGAPESIDQEYEITVSKSGYETVATYPPYPTTAFDPVDEHAAVLEGGLTNKVITSDPLADVDIRTVDSQGDAIADALLTISGGRILGENPDTEEDIYNYNQDIAADGSGEYDMDDVSPGSYDVVLRGATDTGYVLAYVSPGDDLVANRFPVDGGASPAIDVVLMDNAVPGLLVNVLNNDDDSPIAGADVRLENAVLGYDETVPTNAYGVALFPNTSTDLVNDTYTLSVTATGFGDESDSVVVNNLTEKEIKMTPS